MQRCMYSGKVVEIEQRAFIPVKLLNSGKSGCVWAKSVCIRAKMLYSGKKGLYSGKSDCIWLKSLYSGKRGCIRAK